MRLGAHESMAGGLENAVLIGQRLGCESVQLFVKSNRQWSVKPLTEEDIRRFKEAVETTGIHPVVAHASYLLNLAAPKEDLWKRSLETLQIELERCEALGIPYLVLHPGSHMGAGEEEGLKRIAKALSELHRRTPGFKSRVLLEVAAGQGTNLGYRFEHLRWIMDHTAENDRLGTCLDTCHLFAAGYDIRTPEAYEETMEAFDRVIGLETLKVWHLNDSKHDLGSRKDRHEHIGKGKIGLEGFRLILRDPRYPPDMPGLLETPKSKDLHEDRENLATLRRLRGE